MTAERCGAASLDRGHGMPLRGRQRRAMLVTESRAEVAEHVRHFQPLAGHETRASGGHQVRHGWRLMSIRDSSGLVVAQTVLVAIMRYCAVVLRLRWPSSNWMVRRSVPASSRWTAKAWRSECGVTGLPMPHRSRTSRQVRFDGGWRRSAGRAGHRETATLRDGCASNSP